MTAELALLLLALFYVLLIEVRFTLTCVFLDDDLPSLDDATTSVDALVADEPSVMQSGWQTPDRYGTPQSMQGPPGFLSTSHIASSSVDVQRPPPGFSTPSVPTPRLTDTSYASAAVVQPPEVEPKSFALPDEEFPALGTPKPRRDQQTVRGLSTPRVLSIKQENDKAELKVENAGAQASDSRASSFTTPPRPGTKTLRVKTAPKDEKAAVSSPATSMASVASRSVSLVQRPDTPASEGDSVSAASPSAANSRPPSPSLGKASSSTRTTTKSQQRKQRKEALKQETKLISEAAQAAPEEHAPVLGRKKKQKKEKPPKDKHVPARVNTEQTQIESPAEEPPEKNQEDELDSPKPAENSHNVTHLIPQQEEGETDNEAAKESEQIEVPTQQASPESGDVTQAGPSSIFNDIKDSLWTSVADKLHLFTAVTNTSPRNEGSSAAPKLGRCRDTNCKCGDISPEDIETLRAGKPVRKQFHADGSRMLVTPNGDCVRGLTAEEEDTFLALQSDVAAGAEHPGTFVAPRHQTGNGAFSLIKGRAVPNGRPNIFPQNSTIQPHDPIGKLQREDALSYINQYVLPRLNLGASVAAAGGSASGHNGTKPQMMSPRDAAAASLNSLAPYFYGPDAAAGVGIYSSSDGTRSIKDLALATQAEDGGIRLPNNGAGSMPLMSVEEAEIVLAASRKETEKLEKSLNAVIRRNKRLVLGGN